MERKKIKSGGGFYIAICCCLVIIAIVGYANRLSSKPEQEQGQSVAENKTDVEKEPIISIKPTVAPAVTQKPKEVAKSQPAPAAENKEKTEKVSFSAPVDGKIIGEFSGDDLVYNETLKDWRAHSGVDFDAKSGEQVVCSANGIVEDVFESSLGKCVVVDHRNGFRTMYANLNDEVAVKAGDELSTGDVIGSVGDTALGDITNQPHLHFEISKKDESVNPADYLE